MAKGRSGGGDSGGLGGASRRKAVRLKTARGRKPSSQRWLQRQLNDPYVAEAGRLGYRSRAAFKIIQLDEKVGLFKPGMRVVDLGAAPGGWTQIAVDRVGSAREGNKKKGKVVALDILEMEPVPGATVLQADFMDDAAPDLLKQHLDGQADLVLSDMAAPTTGHSKTDHLRIMGLLETALMFAEEVLAPGGAFVAKVFQGGSEKDVLDTLRRCFKTIRHVKPPASRPGSSENYVVATGFRGGENNKNEQ